MIEAVNSTVANASSLRANVEAVSVLRSAADVAPPVQIGDTKVIELPKAPYISPYIVIDRNYNKAVLQIRDSDTGDVVQQFPTESRLAQISRVQAKAQRAVEAQVAPRENDQETSPAPIRQTSSRSDIITVQEVTASKPANAPSQAAAALFAGSEAAKTVQASSVDVFA